MQNTTTYTTCSDISNFTAATVVATRPLPLFRQILHHKPPQHMDKEDLFASHPSSSACDSDSDPLLAVAGPSAPLGFQLGPPPFLDDTNVLNYKEEPIELAYIPPGGEQPPPKFTPYKAEFFISGREIVSHDPHLNEDGAFTTQCSFINMKLTTLKGEALYRFLLSQAKRRPDYYLHLRGTHEEKKSRIVSDTDLNGDTTLETEHYTETVTGMACGFSLNATHTPSRQILTSTSTSPRRSYTAPCTGASQTRSPRTEAEWCSK